MTTLPGSGQLSLLQVRNHLGGTGEVALPDDLYRGQLVPDVQQFTGSGFRSNDTGSRNQILRLFIHDSFNSGSPPGTYTIDFNTGTGAPFETNISGVITPVSGAAVAIREIETEILGVYPAFEFSQVSHHTAQASSVEINCTTASIVSSGIQTIYLHGNFMNDDAGFIEVEVPAGEGGVELATRLASEMNADKRSLFTIERTGAEILVGSTGRVNFWISDSADGETFSFPTSIWAIRPAVRELTPEFGSRRETGNPPIDVGSDAGLSVLINTVQNGNPPNSAVYNPDPSSVNYWLELTTVVEGNTASATDEIIRIAIEDDFNAGAATSEYPDHIPNCIELAGFNSVTHSVGDNFSFSTGGSIRSQSTSNAWSLTQGGGSGTSDAVELELTNDSGSVVDFTNGRVDVSITVTSLPTGTDPETRPILHVQSSGSLFLDISTATDPIDQLGEYIFSDVTADIDEAMIQSGESLRIYFQEDDSARQGFEYTVNYVRLSTNQAEYKPAGTYPDITDSIAAIRFTQETFPTGTADSFAADGQLDGPTNGWIFHPTTTSPRTILFEREFDSVDLSNGRIDVSLDIISLPPGFNFITDRITIGMDVVNTTDSSLLWNHERSGINITGEHLFEANTVEDGGNATVASGSDLSIYFYIDDANHRGLTYNVNYVRISTTSEAYTPTGGPASYTLNVDVGDIVFDGTIEDNFVAGSTATEALQHIGNSARDQYAQITVDTVTDGFVTNAISDRGFTGLQREGLTSFRIPDSWDLRLGGTPGSMTDFPFEFWADFVNSWFWFTGDYEPEGTSGTITITDSNQVTNRANFDWNDINRFTRTTAGGVTFPVTALRISADNVPSSGAPLAGATFSLAITDDGVQVPAKQIELHTNQTNDLMQTFGITPNTAINTISQISEFAVGGTVSGTNSSYTITDPSGSTMSLTSYSRENLASISSRIREAVNDMTDTPTDFTAVVLNNEILLKPTSGLVDNDWTLLVNHGSGNDGSIGYTHSRPNSNVPTSGQLSLPTTFYNVENGEVE